ncbi:AAA family ATPase [Nocardia farcinica]|uniref:HelD family protein n=1 Tax=Nocardia farcinica TaxID=37329 RepID=UPI000A3C56E4|nr:ATP-binding domain-containing protein [Nocardia farcinica]MBA4855962.1 AAA family ATPase [Nocardia farcinica]MBC9818583.1 AAA family ATPase [Nocardia farcinica]MBF6265789.1 AAA family ATPase [Nocardia farcinica]MBF6284264.1 AAA family ATPase [Nocardia farcinica]MBF6308517.1 AAA family ATPase [Nocardia farcinica]
MPDRLTQDRDATDAAADRDREIDREQAYLSVLYERLDAMRAYAQNRLRTVLLENGGAPQARSERESFTQLYTEDLAKYDAAEHGLCFGRIDLAEEDEPRYIGRLGILDERDDYATLLLDWRAPLARPFYLATTAAPDGVTRRRHIRTRNRSVTAINDEYLDLDAAQRAGMVESDGGVGSESALLAALNAARTGHMTDIVETIQSEQDAIIRSEHKSVLVVQGGPGTGKTAVALHRAAYLLYNYRQQLAKSGVLIVGPNATFLDYIGQVLPSLGETGVLLSTIGDLYPGVKATRTDTLRAGEIKGSLRILEVLKQAVRDRQEVPAQPIELSFDGYPVRLDKKIVTKARGRARSSRRPHNLARPIFANSVIDALTDQLAQTMGADLSGGPSLLSRADLAEIRDEMKSDSAVQAAIGRLWPLLTPQQVLADLLADPARLDRAGASLTPEERAELVRPDTGEFSAADAPLLDELAELLGVDDTEERERARRRWRAKLAEAQDALDILTGSAPQDLEDDLDPEILMAYDLIDASQLAERQDVRTRLTAAERAAGDRTWTYGHVIVDEAQELSEMAWRMVMRRIPNRWMTVVGDVAQTGDPAGAASWQQVLEPYVAQRWKLTELTVNYRTPAEIMTVAADVLAAIDPAATAPRSVRETGHRPRAERVTEAELPAAVARAVAEHHGPGTTAVIAPHELTDALAEVDGEAVRVLTVSEVKGLEFDTVLLVEPARIVEESPRGLNDLYVALTRATQRLHVLHTAELPEVLGALA